MMWRFAFVLAIFCGGPACAQTIAVTSGEHDTFSRLVFALPTAEAWQLGRTANGYELSVAGEEARFDVSGVFDLIPKDRLAGIFVDPASGRLQMTIGCQCHALPFSLDDRTIVIDLRDGPPPAGSSFEQGLDGTVWPALQGRPTTQIRPRPRQLPSGADPAPAFDWLTADLPSLEPTGFELPPVTSDAAATIRESLVAQLADGASRNVIELAIPDSVPKDATAPYLPDNLPIRVPEGIGVQIGNQRIAPDEMQTDGTACIADEALSISTWAGEDTLTAQYSGLHTGLVGEFDRPQDAAIVATAKRQIYLGFGAEARSTLTAFGDLGGETPVLRSLASLIDGDEPLDGAVFSGMASCDTAAAMWDVIADPSAVTSSLNAGAVKRSFSALPPHLRTHLGPRLIENLLAKGRNDIAFDITEAMGRGTATDRRAITLAETDLLLANGAAAEAVPALETVLADPGQMQAEALTKLVTAQVAADKPVEPTTADALYAMIDEYEGHPLLPDLRRAYGLALAGSRQFAKAREFATSDTPLDPAFWTVLAAHGSDDDLLLFAITPPDTDVPHDAAQAIAERLTSLGFSQEAQLWRAAKPAEMADGVPAMPSEASTPANENGDELAARMARWNQNWAEVAQSDTGAWGQLAQGLTANTSETPDATLASANAALSESTAARALIEALIAETAATPASP
jgi:hypothetical protein